MSHIQHDTQARLDAGHVVGSELTYLIAHLVVVHVHLTDQVGQFTRVDLHRTRGGTKTIGSTCLITIILVLLT